MLCVCVGDVMDVVFSVYIVRRGVVGDAGRGCNRRPYKRGILQSRSHNCFIGSHECLILITPSCCSECLYDL